MKDAVSKLALEEALNYLSDVIKQRLEHFFSGKKGQLSFQKPAKKGKPSHLELFAQKFGLNEEEFLIVLIALAPHIQSDFFDRVIQKHLPEAGDFPQIGGIRGEKYRGFLPTGETALFLLGGTDIDKRFQIQKIFGEDHVFARKRILWLAETPQGEPRMSGNLILSQEYVDICTVGKFSRPRFSMTFPAEMIETQMEWDDLILNDQTLEQIHELETWIEYGDVLMDKWGMQRKLKPGYRALFYGPPGTGKTLTASLLGKYTGKDVYRVDLSMVVSKFIGETEKNLSNLFAKAQDKDWILFFDEADALFGKRTNVKDAHDKYANQEVAYLLQRVEGYNGLVILATNFKSNIDDAFMRRFQSVIHFPMPNDNERLKLWELSFPDKVELSPEVDLVNLSKKYELSGSGIVNVVQYCCLESLGRGDFMVNSDDIKKGIRKEFHKEGKLFN
ncbi:MAG: ATP-binding protein [Bacteroidetes bacterium]|nr:ATP-binding protein [Bacteroidota bacterium]